LDHTLPTFSFATARSRSRPTSQPWKLKGKEQDGMEVTPAVVDVEKIGYWRRMSSIGVHT
jgi:hypothetical protein